MEKSAGFRQKEQLWQKDFIFISLISLFTFIGFQMLLPTLPVYVNKLGAGDTSVGLVVGVFTISAILIRPFVGQALDVYGRKGIFIAGMIIFTACVLGYIWAPTLLVLLAIRFMHGFGWGISSTAASTVAADIIPKSRMGEGMGYYGLAGTIAMALAPALGLFMIDRFSFNTMFSFSAFMVMIAIFLAFFIDYRGVASTRRKLSLIEKAALRPTLVIFFVTMTYGAIVAFIALYAAQRGISNIGSFFTVYAVSLTIIRPLAGSLSDKRGFDVVVIPGIILILMAMILLYFAAGIKWFLIAAVVYGAGFGAVQPSLQAMAIVFSPPERRGAANATFFTGFDLGIGISSIMWGVVAGITGYSLMYLLSVIPVLAALVSYLLVGRRANPSPGPQ
ncbi:MAG: MFS transporter [Desulfotomaculaceae bacterium]|nr:MFS transporter [Desulfotomaculaceae bacterium]